MAKKDSQDKHSSTNKDTTEHDRRSGTNLNEQPVVTDTDIKTVDESKDGEIVMPTREHEANIERAQKLAEENSEHDQA